jgi:quinol-cytochrome oxidoreductase complex cytochrome b subunit
MDAIKSLNVAVRFLLEICVLVSVGYWGFKTGSGWFLKILLGIGAPFLIAIIWGTFGAPKAANHLTGSACWRWK